MAVEWVENRLLKQAGWDDDPTSAPISAEDALVSVIGERDKAMALLPYFTIRDIKAGDTLFRQGDDDYDTILLVRGTLSAHLDLGGGQSVRLRKFLPGTLTGEMAFYTDRKRSASLMADTDATIGVISGASLLRLNRGSARRRRRVSPDGGTTDGASHHIDERDAADPSCQPHAAHRACGCGGA